MSGGPIVTGPRPRSRTGGSRAEQSILSRDHRRAAWIARHTFSWLAANEVPTERNPLGVKGVGEAGTVGALPAVMNAVNDALHRIGAPTIEMPASHEKVWRAIQAAHGR